MPRRNGPKVLSQHHGVLPVPPRMVRADLLDVRTGTLTGDAVPLVLGSVPGRAVHITGGPTTFAVTLDGLPMTIDTDPDEGWVQARGQWWWCRRFQVTDHPTGTLLTQRTYNLATGPAALLVPFAVERGHAERGRNALRSLLDELGRRHRCEGHLLD